jgi:hypothetical protein
VTREAYNIISIDRRLLRKRSLLNPVLSKETIKMHSDTDTV